MHKTLVTLTMLLSLGWSCDISAWGQKGHRAVALAAYGQLQPGVKAKVDGLLSVKHFDTLGEASVWPDRVRDTEVPAFSHTGPWHYVNLPPSASDFDRARDCPSACAVSALEQMLVQLRHPDARKRAEALAFIVHIVADIHQPLHVGYAHDRGGNDYPFWVGAQKLNLHYYWDVIVLRDAGSVGQLKRALSARLEAKDDRGQQDQPVSTWLAQSHAITRQIYQSQPTRMADNTLRQDRNQALQQLTLATSRLAYLLNRHLSQ